MKKIKKKQQQSSKNLDPVARLSGLLIRIHHGIVGWLIRTKNEENSFVYFVIFLDLHSLDFSLQDQSRLNNDCHSDLSLCHIVDTRDPHLHSEHLSSLGVTRISSLAGTRISLHI
jgi:hypothetical protein